LQALFHRVTMKRARNHATGRAWRGWPPPGPRFRIFEHFASAAEAALPADTPLRIIWARRSLDSDRLAAVLAQGAIVVWVQGRCKLGPRALGNRSLLAEPFHESTRDRLNVIKQREDYRPIAPCCRLEDAGRFFCDDFDDHCYTRGECVCRI
jgi:predicted NodU family carbamoyl transferase